MNQTNRKAVRISDECQAMLDALTPSLYKTESAVIRAAIALLHAVRGVEGAEARVEAAKAELARAEAALEIVD